MEREENKFDDLQMHTARQKMVSVDPTDHKRKHPVIQMTDGVLIPRKGDGHVLNSWRITFFSALALLAGLII
ncbi:MAG TPA: amino acid ABC transporter permease, partial [Sphaerochaeta sp.]|nr:amino acid ABC transporter permease [Sphaerochaeta sp.]